MAGEFNWGGLGGGPGGIAFPDILTALGTALLSSPRDAPFANLPQTLQTGVQASQQRQSNAALAMALKQAGVENPELLAMSPTAASLAISQANLNKKLALGQSIGETVGRFYGGTGNMGLGAPATSAPATPPPTSTPASPVSAAPGDNPFLKLVSQSEGTDPSVTPQASGLNTTLGYGRFSGGPRDLTGMTVNQVLDMQKEMLNHPENNLNSSAAGAFQVVGKTLRRLRDAGVVGGDDPYDANTQTKIGNHLAMARGRDAGGLRQEWAGLKGVPDDQILAAYDAAYGPNARGPAQAGGPAFPPQVLPGTQSPPVQVAQSSTGTVSDAQPVQVAAAGKFPVPIPPDATKPLAATGYGAETTTMQALAKRKQATAIEIITKAAGMGEEGKPFVELGKLMFEDAAQYLKPTDMQRAVAAAGKEGTPEGQAALQSVLEQHVPEAQRNARFATGGTATEPPATRHAREVVKRGLPDTRPDVVKLGEARQDTPGLVASGTEAEAARKQADAEAAARAELAKTATSGAIAVKPLQEALKQAATSYKNVADAGGIGLAETNPVSRFFSKHLSTDAPQESLLRHVLPRTMTDAHSIELERQKFDNAMAMVKNAVTAVRAKGQGAVSNVERVLLGADFEGLLSSPDRQIAEQALGRLQSDIDRAAALDDEKGLYRGDLPIQTPYGTLREKR